jgi:signal transduction histidine kinase
MIIKEAMNNSIKYAKADCLSLSISLLKNKPMIVIKDDGAGFNCAKLSEGNGLSNMRTRAKEIGYDIYIQAACGVTIKLQKE